MSPENFSEVIVQDADFNCFTDEVELEETEKTNLTLLYFGVLVSTDQHELESKIKGILSVLGVKKFHSHRTYRNPLFKNICGQLTTLIIEHNLRVVFFPFSRVWQNNPKLAVLKNFELPDLKRVKSSNYRSHAWLLFIHVFNTHLMDRQGSKKTRIIFDSDWLKKNEMVVHEGVKLKALTEIISSVQKNMPLLALADHVGYMFQKLKNVTYNDNGILMLSKYDKKDTVTRNAVLLFEHLISKNLFHRLDVWEWISNENRK
jgi:hypothetical protein